MKKLFTILTIYMSIFIGVLALNPHKVSGADISGNCGTGIVWTLDDNGILTISGKGAMGQISFANKYASRIEKVIIKTGITSISSGAFQDCYNITDVTIADSVTKIGDKAFWNCDHITTVKLSAKLTKIGDKAFGYCGRLQSITLPGTLTTIGKQAFLEDTSLLKITIPSSVTLIDEYAFDGCSLLNTITIPKGAGIGANAFSGTLWLKNRTDTFVVVGNGYLIKYNGTAKTVSIPSTVKVVNEAFKNNKYITNVAIPTTVTAIGSEAFKNCPSLAKVTINGKITRIGEYAFSGCKVLSGITIPSTVKSIGDGAFSMCKTLASINIPASVKTIGDWAFLECTKLSKVTFSSGIALTHVGTGAFEDSAWLKAQTAEYVVIGNGWLIKYNGKGTSITIPSSVKYIADAFGMCDTLTNVNMRYGVLYIGESAFEFCSNLKSIYIPASVKEIGQMAFLGCDKLTSIMVLSSKMIIDDGAFFNMGSNKITFKSLSGSTTNTYAANNKSPHAIIINDISKATVSTIANYKYTMKAITPSFTVKLNGRTLTKNVDYKVTYSDNINTGKCTVTITGIGDYKNSIKKSFTIYAKGSSGTGLTWTFNSKTGNLSVTGKGAMHNWKKTNTMSYNYLKSKIKTVTISSGITSIGNYAFYGCKNLTKVTGTGNINRIGNYAFYGCKSLKTVGSTSGRVTLGKIKTIGTKAFYQCYAMTYFVSGGYLTSIGSYAFYGDYSLAKIYLKTAKLTAVSTNAFKGIKSNARIYVPSSKLSSYKKGVLKGKGQASTVVITKY